MYIRFCSSSLYQCETPSVLQKALRIVLVELGRLGTQTAPLFFFFLFHLKQNTKRQWPRRAQEGTRLTRQILAQARQRPTAQRRPQLGRFLERWIPYITFISKHLLTKVIVTHRCIYIIEFRLVKFKLLYHNLFDTTTLYTN